MSRGSGKYVEKIYYLIEDKITRYYLLDYTPIGGDNIDFRMTSEVWDAMMWTTEAEAEQVLEALDYNKFEVVEHMFYYE